MTSVLERLTATIRERASADPSDSYVAALNAKGLNKILEKVGEEATEVILAAKDASTDAADPALIHEVADLWFHTLVMLVHLNQSPEDVLDALAAREGVSGHAEKASRGASS